MSQASADREGVRSAIRRRDVRFPAVSRRTVSRRRHTPLGGMRVLSELAEDASTPRGSASVVGHEVLELPPPLRFSPRGWIVHTAVPCATNRSKTAQSAVQVRRDAEPTTSADQPLLARRSRTVDSTGGEAGFATDDLQSLRASRFTGNCQSCCACSDRPDALPSCEFHVKQALSRGQRIARL